VWQSIARRNPDARRDPRTVDTHILKLRQKIEPAPANPTVIQTVCGTGYRFAG